MLTLSKSECNNEFAAFVADAECFISNCISVVDNYPLQLYSSAIVFCPERSLVRRMFMHSALSLLSTLPKQTGPGTLVYRHSKAIKTLRSLLRFHMTLGYLPLALVTKLLRSGIPQRGCVYRHSRSGGASNLSSLPPSLFHMTLSSFLRISLGLLLYGIPRRGGCGTHGKLNGPPATLRYRQTHEFSHGQKTRRQSKSGMLLQVGTSKFSRATVATQCLSPSRTTRCYSLLVTQKLKSGISRAVSACELLGPVDFYSLSFSPMIPD